ncbi:MAG: hypothetical protein HFJ50_00365 [Clostridia bacterium]|jgi:hypothetical protein|nr:hypothetical protein [Clostridia bacterium]
MGLLDFFKSKKQTKQTEQLSTNSKVRFPGPFADASTITADERPFYQPAEYYTLESYAGTPMAEKVITLEDRKKTTFPSKNGLYIGEIMLLEYCNSGTYPKPANGYPGFWWFKYGIRDIGHALETLEKRGFIRWGLKTELLNSLKVEELKKIAAIFKIKITQSKQKLVADITNNVKESELPEEYFSKKYVLTELGKKELKENEYVVYMHKHKLKTNNNVPQDISFTVWDVNRLLADNDKTNWRTIVADFEEKSIGIRMADKVSKKVEISDNKIKSEILYTKEDISSYINSIIPEVKEAAKKKGDGLNEELEGLNYKKNGDDKKALYYLYIAIEKNFDAPALYKETAKILRKYKLYEEELKIIEIGLKSINSNSSPKELLERREKVSNIIKKNM